MHPEAATGGRRPLATMERFPGKRQKQSEEDTTLRRKLRKGDADAPVIVLSGEDPEAKPSVSEQLRGVDFGIQLLNVPAGPLPSNLAPPSSLQDDTSLARRGSLDSTDRNVVTITAVDFAADGSAARVGGLGAFSSSNAGPQHFPDVAGGYALSGTVFGSGAQRQAGPSEAPAEAAAGLAAMDASRDMFGTYQMLLNMDPEQQHALADIALLQEKQLCRVVHGRERLEGKIKGHTVVACSAYVVFPPSVEQLTGCSDDAALELLARSKPVLSSLGPGFHGAFAARQKECQQPCSAKLFVVSCAQRFLMHPSVENSQRQLLYTTDSAIMKRSSKHPEKWPAADAGERKLAVDLLVAAAVWRALGTHPDLPPGLLLFSVKPQPRKATGPTSTFYGKMQKLETS